jgi:hypothetical protein
VLRLLFSEVLFDDLHPFGHFLIPLSQTIEHGGRIFPTGEDNFPSRQFLHKPILLATIALQESNFITPIFYLLLLLLREREGEQLFPKAVRVAILEDKEGSFFEELINHPGDKGLNNRFRHLCKLLF